VRKGPRFKNHGFELTTRLGRVRYDVPAGKWTDEQEQLAHDKGAELLVALIKAEKGRAP
jgi:hypothetical protein